MIGIVLFTVVLLASGFIAFLGDFIGRKVGKKRLSLFGLRPRKFAVFVSVISGVIISLFTLGVLTAVSPQARQALFGLEKLKNEKKIAEAKLQRKEKEVLRFESNLQVKKKDLNKISLKLSAVTAQYRDILRQTEREKKALQTARKDLAESSKQNRLIQEALRQKRAQLSQAQEKIVVLTSQLDPLLARTSELDATKKNLEEKVQRLKEQGNEVFARLAKAQKDLDKIKEEKKQLTTAFQKIRRGKVVVQAHEPLGYITFSNHITRKEAQEKIIQTLSKLDLKLKQRGAGTDARGNYLIIYERNFQSALAKILEQPKQHFIRVLSSANVLKGEPVPATLEVEKNQKILAAGEVLTKGDIQPGSDRETVERELIDLITGAREKAIQIGMLPEAEFQTLPLKDFVQLVQLILQTKVPLLAQTIVAEDLYISGPLSLWLDVREKK